LADAPVDDVGEASFEGAAGFVGGFVLGEFPLVGDVAWTEVAGLADGDGVQGGVGLTVAAGV